jgi:MraZ protein
MFQGQYTSKVGAFFRVAFPSSYRDRLEERIIITYGFEQSLIITSENQWDTLYKKEIEGKSFLIPEVRDIRRFFLGGMSAIEFDKQGRFIVPEYLRAYASIEVQEEVSFIWQREYIELWNAKKWEEREKQVLNTITKLAEKLSGNDSKNEYIP